MDELSGLTEPNVLLTAPAFHGPEASACAHLVAPAERTALVGVTLSKTADQWLSAYADRLAELPDRVWIVDVGEHARSAASEGSLHQPAGGTTVSVTPVGSPGNLTDLGVALVESFEELTEADDADVALCFGPIAPYYQYAGSETVFQFLQILTGHVRANGISGHYHLNPGAIDEQDRLSLEHLFDAVVALEDDEWTVETPV